MDKDREAFDAWCKEIVGVARDLEAACERLAAGRPQKAYDAMIEGGQADALLALDRARAAVREVIAVPIPPAPAALAYARERIEGAESRADAFFGRALSAPGAREVLERGDAIRLTDAGRRALAEHEGEG